MARRNLVVCRTAMAVALAATLLMPTVGAAAPVGASGIRSVPGEPPKATSSRVESESKPEKPGLAAATGVHATAADDWFPGVPIAASPFGGYLEKGTDDDDLYSVYLSAGQEFVVSMSGPGDADFDIYLFNVAQDWVVRSNGVGSSEYFTFTATTAGTYYLDVTAYSGYGSYTVNWSKSGGSGGEPVPASGYTKTVIWPPNPVCNYNGSAKLTGALTTANGVALKGRWVYIQKWPYGATNWVDVGRVPTADRGHWAATVYPTKRTAYRAQFRGAGSLYASPPSGKVYVTPKAALTAPSAPADIKVGGVFSSVGYLMPRHSPGAHTVVLRCSRLEGGYWVRRKTVYTTNQNYNGQTRYSAKVALPLKGRWKIVAAVAGDNTHAATEAKPRYVSVGRTIMKMGLSRDWCDYSHAVTISGRLVTAAGSPISGATVVLERWDGASWRALRNLTTNSYGRVSTSVKPEEDRYFRMHYKGSTKRASSVSAYDWVDSRKISWWGTTYSGHLNWSGYSAYVRTGKHRVKVQAQGNLTNLYLMYNAGSSFRTLSNGKGAPVYTTYVTLPRSDYYYPAMRGGSGTYVNIEIW